MAVAKHNPEHRTELLEIRYHQYAEMFSKIGDTYQFY